MSEKDIPDWLASELGMDEIDKEEATEQEKKGSKRLKKQPTTQSSARIELENARKKRKTRYEERVSRKGFRD